jgi:hypothetical protein
MDANEMDLDMLRQVWRRNGVVKKKNQMVARVGKQLQAVQVPL